MARGQETEIDVREGFTGLTYHDAAGLFLAVVRAQVRGFRVYMAGTSHRHRELALSDLLRTFYPDAPATLPDLIDDRALRAEIGWAPSDDYANRAPVGTDPRRSPPIPARSPPIPARSPPTPERSRHDRAPS